jgi:4-amino-4-deoxy-L-arabinose transferase-like glycosyltransferase
MSTLSSPAPAEYASRPASFSSGRNTSSILPRRLVTALFLTGLCGLFFFYGLNAGQLWRTESLRAIIAAEFLRSGNWVVPRLYGEPLFTKPPGMYGAIALVSWPLGGVTEWTARLPSALAATATVLLFFWYFRRQLGDGGGLVAATVLPMSFMWLDKASSAEIDMLQVFWVSAALLFLFRALETDRWTWWLLALSCVAGGVLTKWTAPAFFYGTALPLLWRRGRLHLLWGRQHLVSAALAASLCLAWIAAAVYLTGWEPFYETVSREALQRLSPSHHLEVQQRLAPHHHRGYPWLGVLAHPLVILGGSLPWSPLALITLWPGFARLWDERGRKLLQALHCWVWPNLLFWSIIPEHAPRHSFPLYPGIAGLAAMVWVAWLTGRLPWRLRVRPKQVLAGSLALWLCVKLAFIHVLIPHRNVDREPRGKGHLLASQVPVGQILYLFHLKDEGIMFYFGREVRRLPSVECLPSSGEPMYCILDAVEWERLRTSRRVTLLQHLRDEQGDPIVLVRLAG